MNKADRDFAERLVMEVEKRPILYIPTHPGYKDRIKVEMEWASVAQEFNSTAEAVRRRWQNLRGSFSKCLTAKKITKNGEIKNYFGRFYLFDQMSFLLGHMANARALSNHDEYHQSLQDIQEFEFKENYNSEDEEPPVITVPSPTPSTSSVTISPSTSAFVPTTTAMLQRKRPRDDYTQGWEEPSPTISTSQQSSTDCPELNFFKGVVPMVKELTKRRKCLFYADVINLMVKHLDEQEMDDA